MAQCFTVFSEQVLCKKVKLLAVAARGKNDREGCELLSLVEHLGLSPWLFLMISGVSSHSSSPILTHL